MEKKRDESGAKRRQRTDYEDRSLVYRLWHRRLGRGFPVQDVDQVEYTIIDGKIYPVAVLEITRFDGVIDPPEKYFQAIIYRFTERDWQGRAIWTIANMLGVRAYIVLFRRDMKRFWIYDLMKGWGGWWTKLSEKEYVDWLKRLREAKRKEVRDETA